MQINKNFRIKGSFGLKNYNDLMRDIGNFSANLKAKNIKKCSIFLSSYYDFLVAFFGASAISPYILPNINKQNGLLICDKIINEFLLPNDEKIDMDFSNKSFFILTSGSSGESKIIEKSFKSMFLEAMFLSEFLGVNDGDFFISSVSHQHLYGLSFKVFLPLVCGACVENEELNYPELILDYELENKIFITSPILLKYLANYPLDSISKLKFAISAGNKLETKMPFKIIEIYGSTESGVIARNLGRGFRIFPMVKARIKNGVLVVKSPWCAEFISSDLARIEGDKLFLLGRSDRVVKLADKRVSLDEIQQKLKSSEILSDAFVGLERNKTKLSAIICLNERGVKLFLRGGKMAINEYIKDFLNNEFGSSLRFLYIRENIPYNAQGKVTKRDFANAIKAKIKPEFNILEQDSTHLVASSRIPLDCFYFDGHFRNFPLVPGFEVLGFVLDLAKKLNINHFYEVESVKFSAFMRPLDEVLAYLYLDSNKLKFSLKIGDKECASGRIKI